MNRSSPSEYCGATRCIFQSGKKSDDDDRRRGSEQQQTRPEIQRLVQKPELAAEQI